MLSTFHCKRKQVNILFVDYRVVQITEVSVPSLPQRFSIVNGAAEVRAWYSITTEFCASGKFCERGKKGGGVFGCIPEPNTPRELSPFGTGRVE